MKKEIFFMFDYPIPKRENTLYSKLQISPDATEQQINDAVSRIKSSLNEKKGKLSKTLDQVYKAYPKIRELEKNLNDIRCQKEADLSKLQSVLKKIRALEESVLKEFPWYKNHLETIEKVDKEINEINTMKLDKPTERANYNIATPPCALLKLEKIEVPLFKDTKVAQFLLRKEMAVFLKEKFGISTYHPSDFTRDNFQSDFRRIKSLDGAQI
jgi:hypothetical protein